MMSPQFYQINTRRRRFRGMRATLIPLDEVWHLAVTGAGRHCETPRQPIALRGFPKDFVDITRLISLGVGMSSHPLDVLETRCPCHQSSLLDVLDAVPIPVAGRRLAGIRPDDFEVHTGAEREKRVAGSIAKMPTAGRSLDAEKLCQFRHSLIYIACCEYKVIDHAVDSTRLPVDNPETAVSVARGPARRTCVICNLGTTTAMEPDT